jgi:hypothetical protein
MWAMFSLQVFSDRPDWVINREIVWRIGTQVVGIVGCAVGAPFLLFLSQKSFSRAVVSF